MDFKSINFVFLKDNFRENFEALKKSNGLLFKEKTIIHYKYANTFDFIARF